MVASRESDVEANCWRRCSNVFMLRQVSFKVLSASGSSGYCLAMERTSL